MKSARRNVAGVNQMSAKFFVLAILLVLGSGCSSLQAPRKREMVLENSWARMTTKNEFLGFRRMNRMSPLLLEDRIIQANSIDGISAFERKTGALIWRRDLVNGVEGGAQVVGNKLYFGSSDGQFYCVNAGDGKTLWSYPVRSETLAAPTVENGIVYFQSGTEVVYSLDAETGKQLWVYNRQVTTNLSIRATTRPIIAGDLVLVGFSDGFLVALRKRDGALAWERKLGRGNRFHDVDSTPVVDGSNVYVASYDAALFSLNVETGAVNWSVDGGAYVPVTLGRDQFSDRIYHSTVDGKILVLDKSSGKQLGLFVVERGIATQSTFFKNLLLYGESEGGLVVADPQTGKQLAKFFPGHGLVARPAVHEASGEAYFISNNANLYAVKIGYRTRAGLLPWHKTL